MLLNTAIAMIEDHGHFAALTDDGVLAISILSGAPYGEDEDHVTRSRPSPRSTSAAA